MIMKRISAATVLVFLVISPELALSQTQAGGSPRSRVFGGVAASNNEFPSIAAISIKNGTQSGSFSCGASLIAQRFVLTAAHCVHTNRGLGPIMESRQLQIRVGSLSWREGGQRADVARIIAHPDYNKTGMLENDIALLELDRPLAGPFMNLEGLAARNEPQPRLLESQKVTVAGWGVMDPLVPVAAPILQKAELFREENRLCKRFGNEGLTMQESTDTICAGVSTGGMDSCTGDSGGPLMGALIRGRGWAQVGLVSYGPSECGTANEFAVYTRISSYRQWIADNTRSFTAGTVAGPSLPSLPSALGLLQPIASRGGLTLDIVESRNRAIVPVSKLTIDQTVKFQLHTDRAGDLFVFAIQSDGSVRQVEPTLGRPVSVGAHTPILVPGIGADPFKIVGPIGRHRLVAIVVPSGSPLLEIFPAVVSGQVVGNPNAGQSLRNLIVAKKEDRQPNPTPTPTPTPTPELTRDWRVSVIDYQVFPKP
jgi:secreted trypsin-like serine protease